jgi:hypothetical protein
VISDSEIRDPSRWQAPPAVASAQRWALVIGGLGAALGIFGYLSDSAQFFRSYLVAYLFWLTIALGCVASSMLTHITGGQWGLVVRRVWGAAGRTLPFMLVLFLPIAFGMDELFVWARPEAVAADELLQHKAPYLNETFFLIRAAIYFLFWIAASGYLSRLSLRQDATGDPAIPRRQRAFAAPGLLAFCLVLTFASFDWLMSLDPHWYSTMYGVYMIGGTGLSAFAFLAVAALFLARREPMEGIIKPRHFHDFGKLMLTFVMLWAYFSFSQFLIIWSGNLPEEITFYVERLQGGWQYVALALVVAHFALPFVLLLSRDLKRHARTLAVVAVMVLVMRWIDLFWQVSPVFNHGGFHLHWLDLTLPVAVGGIWLALFAHQLRQRPLLPVQAPGLVEEIRK